MKRIAYGMLGITMLTLLSCLFWMIVLTPEKTLNGEYTQPLKYWTDNTYFVQNFTNK
jgi:hypothetical protein